MLHHKKIKIESTFISDINLWENIIESEISKSGSSKRNQSSKHTVTDLSNVINVTKITSLPVVYITIINMGSNLKNLTLKAGAKLGI